MIYGLSILYIVMAAYLFTVWVDLTDDMSHLSTQQRVLSWMTLSIASALWLLVIPIAYTQLIKAQTHRTLP